MCVVCNLSWRKDEAQIAKDDKNLGQFRCGLKLQKEVNEVGRIESLIRYCWNKKWVLMEGMQVGGPDGAGRRGWEKLATVCFYTKIQSPTVVGKDGTRKSCAAMITITDYKKPIGGIKSITWSHQRFGHRGWDHVFSDGIVRNIRQKNSRGRASLKNALPLGGSFIWNRGQKSLLLRSVSIRSNLGAKWGKSINFLSISVVMLPGMIY